MASRELSQQLVSATIDSDQLYAMTKYKTTKGYINIKKSDHYSIIVRFSMSWEKQMTPREEILKLRDENSLKLFQEKTNNCPRFRKLEDNDTLEKTCNKWYKIVDGIMHINLNSALLSE